MTHVQNLLDLIQYMNLLEIEHIVMNK